MFKRNSKDFLVISPFDLFSFWCTLYSSYLLCFWQFTILACFKFQNNKLMTNSFVILIIPYSLQVYFLLFLINILETNQLLHSRICSMTFSLTKVGSFIIISIEVIFAACMEWIKDSFFIYEFISITFTVIMMKLKRNVGLSFLEAIRFPVVIFDVKVHGAQLVQIKLSCFHFLI